MSNVVNIKVFGVGGAGGNAVNRMINDGVENCEYYVVNTDAQALTNSKAKHKLAIGKLGAGGNPDVGRKCALEYETEIAFALQGADLVYITAGMGGGTGTGAAPEIARIAKKMGALTVAIVTIPFSFEGTKRRQRADVGLERLKENVDCLVLVSNDKLLKTFGNLPMSEGYAVADEILKKGIKSVIDVIQESSIINLDFMDIKSVMKNQGSAIIGIGKGSGEKAAISAATEAVNSPILEGSPMGAKKAIVNVTGGPKLSIFDAYEAIETIKAATKTELDVIFGISNDDKLNDEVIVTLILTGFEK